MKRSSFMNITVIFTGGTIGSSVQQSFVSTDAQMPYRLLAMYNIEQKKKGAAIPHFQTEAPYTTLSEYMDGSHLNLLIACIRDQLTKNIDGIIVTHGTDTLPFTAAALGMCFAYARVPILLVSSNYILDDPRANGLTNFTAAVDYIRNWKHTHNKQTIPDNVPYSSGTMTTDYTPHSSDIATPDYTSAFSLLPTAVGIAYCNTGSTPNIYNALGVYNHHPFDDSLYERSYDAYADAIAPVLQELSGLCKTAMPKDSDACSLTNACEPISPDTSSIHFDTACPVCFFQSMPGMQYYLPDNARAVLIHAYHSGTINTKNPSLLARTHQAAQKKLPVYLTGISAYSTDYDSKAVYESLGIIPLPEYSPLVAYMYLWYKYSQKH